MSKFCAFCGKEIPEEATVCPECNAEIVEPEQTEPEQEVVQEADNGENHFIGGDFIGETESTD